MGDVWDEAHVLIGRVVVRINRPVVLVSYLKMKVRARRTARVVRNSDLLACIDAFAYAYADAVFLEMGVPRGIAIVVTEEELPTNI